MDGHLVEASLKRSGGERVALGIMNVKQALSLVYCDMEFSLSRHAEGMPVILDRQDLLRLDSRK